MTKVNVKVLSYYLIAIICVVSFFSHEFIPANSAEFLAAKQEHLLQKSKRTEALQKVKNYSKGSDIYNKYIIQSEKTDTAWQNLNTISNSEKFIGFDNLQQFLGEFGWVFCFFIYSLFHLILSIKSRSEIKQGKIILNSSTLFISLYYIGWCFHLKQDFETIYYVLACIFVTSMIVFGVFKTIKSYKNINNNLSNLISYILKIRRTYITDLAVKAIDVDEEETINIVLDFENETKQKLEEIAK